VDRDSHRKRQIVTAYARVLIACAVALAAGCSGEKSSTTPAAPSTVTPATPVVVMSVPSVPLTSTATLAQNGRPVHAVTAAITFRETAGVAAHVTGIALQLVDDAGPLAPAMQQPVDVAVPAGGSAQYELRHAFEVERSPESGRARFTGRARDAAGTSFELTLVEVAVRFSVPPPPVVATVVFSGAGDIGLCGSPGPEATARLLDDTPGLVFTLGDNAYPFASADNFRNCYDPSWGRHRARTRPIAGNHDWYNDTWMAYFDYFGASAGTPGEGYYSYDLGAWHVLALNSNLHANAGSPQYEWVRADLAAHPSACILALWHHPRYSSGLEGSNTTMRDVWRLLQGAGAELVLSGHDHDYERFAPQDADGRLDLARGIRQFVVGTGGYTLYDWTTRASNSEVRDNQTWGILRLTLHPGSYDWEFVPVAGRAFRDTGSAQCSR